MGKESFIKLHIATPHYQLSNQNLQKSTSLVFINTILLTIVCGKTKT